MSQRGDASVDARLWFWTASFLNMTLIVLLASLAIRSVRRGQVERHRRLMLASVLLTTSFLAGYAGKLLVLGRENMALWSPTDVTILRVHETFVLLMVLGGSVALFRARSLRDTRNRTRRPSDPPAPTELVRSHRRAGWTAVLGVGCAWALAGAVLLGMYRRAGIF